MRVIRWFWCAATVRTCGTPHGKRYLDFIAGIGVNALGQNHPRIVRVIQEQAARLIHTSNLFYNEYQGPLAKRIAEVSGLKRTFFTNSGTESTEGALKMMKAHGHDMLARKVRNRFARKFLPRPHARARFRSPASRSTARISSR